MGIETAYLIKNPPTVGDFLTLEGIKLPMFEENLEMIDSGWAGLLFSLMVCYNKSGKCCSKNSEGYC